MAEDSPDLFGKKPLCSVCLCRLDGQGDDRHTEESCKDWQAWRAFHRRRARAIFEGTEVEPMPPVQLEFRQRKGTLSVR